MFNYTLLPESELDFVAVVPEEDLPEGERLFLTIDDSPIVVFNLAGRVYAIGDICSHDNGTLGDGDLDGEEIICPRHGARFNIQSGKTMGLPAVTDIPAYPVRVRNGMLEIGFRK